MNPESNHSRWRKLFYMYVAMANGNFSCRIERTKNKDELEALLALTNMLCEELQETFSHHGFISPRRTYLYLSKMDFLLNKDLAIMDFSKEVPDLLEIPYRDLLGIQFREVLDAKSLQLWEEVRPKFKAGSFSRFCLKLDLRTTKDLLIPSNCYVTSLSSGNVEHRFLVSTFAPVVLDDTASDPTSSFTAGKQEYNPPEVFSHGSEVRLAHEVRNYILRNLGESQLDMHNLTRTFFTNESKLKKGFRAVFGITPFQYIKKERLKLAKELVQNSDLPLKHVSYIAGFNSYPYFSASFREEFKISPQKLRKSLSKIVG